MVPDPAQSRWRQDRRPNHVRGWRRGWCRRAFAVLRHAVITVTAVWDVALAARRAHIATFRWMALVCCQVFAATAVSLQFHHARILGRIHFPLLIAARLPARTEHWTPAPAVASARVACVVSRGRVAQQGLVQGGGEEGRGEQVEHWDHSACILLEVTAFLHQQQALGCWC